VSAAVLTLALTEISLFWDQSTDDTDAQSLIGYELYLNGVLDHMVIGGGRTGTYCVGEGPNTVNVRAVDTSGKASAFSNEITAC
jgi:hypothetical protein